MYLVFNPMLANNLIQFLINKNIQLGIHHPRLNLRYFINHNYSLINILYNHFFLFLLFNHLKILLGTDIMLPFYKGNRILYFKVLLSSQIKYILKHNTFNRITTLPLALF